MCGIVFFLMIRRPPRSTQSRSSAASDVYKRQEALKAEITSAVALTDDEKEKIRQRLIAEHGEGLTLSLIHISEPTRPY